MDPTPFWGWGRSPLGGEGQGGVEGLPSHKPQTKMNNLSETGLGSALGGYANPVKSDSGSLIGPCVDAPWVVWLMARVESNLGPI